MSHNERYKSSIVGLYFRVRYLGITQSRYKIPLVRIDPRFVTSEKKLDRTVRSGLRLNRSYAYMPHSEILERLIILILHFIPNTGSIALNNLYVSPNVLIH